RRPVTILARDKTRFWRRTGSDRRGQAVRPVRYLQVTQSTRHLTNLFQANRAVSQDFDRWTSYPDKSGRGVVKDGACVLVHVDYLVLRPAQFSKIVFRQTD